MGTVRPATTAAVTTVTTTPGNAANDATTRVTIAAATDATCVNIAVR